MTNESRNPTGVMRLYLRKYGFLLYAIGPLAVLVLAQSLFEFSIMGNGNFTQAAHRLVDSAPDLDANQQLLEAAARCTWLTAAFLYIMAILVSTIVSGYIIWQIHGKEKVKPVALACGTFCALLVFSLLLDVQLRTARLRGIYDFTFDALSLSNSTVDPSFRLAVRVLVVAINFLSAIAPVFVVLAGCSCVAPPTVNQYSVNELVERRQLLRVAVGMAALLLGAGVLHMGAWLHWPSALVVDGDAQSAIEELGLSVSTFWGSTFSVMAVTLFVPLQLRLRRQAIHVAEQEFDCADARKAWLKEGGFTMTTTQHIRNVAALITPLLTVPVGDFLTGFGHAG